ncbi:hypothetical protein ACFPJ1_26475 [Kribbella qitaiheensis]|uniref:hypothetical protein n=1 Tax=Kribbella qitaiheensis TaxID=1544730 RepID=UPI003606C655
MGWRSAAAGRAAVLLGAAYGIAVVSGLLEIQRIAAANGGADLAGLTGVYSVAYVGSCCRRSWSRSPASPRTPYCWPGSL